MPKQAERQVPANAQAEYHVTRQALPLCCPMPGMAIWNSHPRVYLAVEQAANHTVVCPYCGSRYILDEA